MPVDRRKRKRKRRYEMSRYHEASISIAELSRDTKPRITACFHFQKSRCDSAALRGQEQNRAKPDFQVVTKIFVPEVEDFQTVEVRAQIVKVTLTCEGRTCQETWTDLSSAFAKAYPNTCPNYGKKYFFAYCLGFLTCVWLVNAHDEV